MLLLPSDAGSVETGCNHRIISVLDDEVPLRARANKDLPIPGLRKKSLLEIQLINGHVECCAMRLNGFPRSRIIMPYGIVQEIIENNAVWASRCQSGEHSVCFGYEWHSLLSAGCWN